MGATGALCPILFKVKEERAYLKIETLEAMENGNISLSLADM